MGRMRWMTLLAVCGLACCVLASCETPPPQNPYTSEFYSGGVKLLSWSGAIKGKVNIHYTPYGIDFRRKWGSRSKGVMQRQHQPMPQRPGICYLDIQQSPGFITVVRQPDRGNNYTCEILIDHNLDEPGRYNFDLYFLSQPDKEK